MTSRSIWNVRFNRLSSNKQLLGDGIYRQCSYYFSGFNMTTNLGLNCDGTLLALRQVKRLPKMINVLNSLGDQTGFAAGSNYVSQVLA